MATRGFETCTSVSISAGPRARRYAPAEGVIQSFGYNPEAGDYGHVIVTEHVIEGVRCWMQIGRAHV